MKVTAIIAAIALSVPLVANSNPAQRKKIISQTIGECGLVVTQEEGELGVFMEDQNYWSSLKPASLQIINESTQKHKLTIGYINYANFNPSSRNTYIVTDVDNQPKNASQWLGSSPSTPEFSHKHVNLYGYITEYPPYSEYSIYMGASWRVTCLD